jgi:hypothetical protein
MFSRFIFYAFNAKPLWKDVSPGTDGINLIVYFEALSSRVLQLSGFSKRKGVNHNVIYLNISVKKINESEKNFYLY